jgi:tetratricopeptide (TPR) repeat protein
MQKLMMGIMVAAMLIGPAGSSVAQPQPQKVTPALGSMTVAELEKAGDAARAVKDYKQAIEYFRTALGKDRKNAVLYNKLGLAELKNGDSRAARSDFQKAAKYNRRYADALNNIGAVDFMQKDANSAARYFKKALALEETRATFHVNLGAAWFAQKKLERAVAEYTRALELDPDVLTQSSKAGVSAQIATPEERAKFSYMLAKIYAQRGDLDRCLECLKKAKEDGYHDLNNVYKEEAFSRLWQDARLAEVVPVPTPK